MEPTEEKEVHQKGASSEIQAASQGAIMDGGGANREGIQSQELHRNKANEQRTFDAKTGLVNKRLRAIESNDTGLQCFILKTQGRSRGYDQDEMKNCAKDIATAAFDFIINKSKNPAES